jgi:uncharacterized membrane protein YfhO
MKRSFILIICLIGAITGVFFWKTLIKGYVPFPGDLLISNYQPWRSYSYVGYAPGGYPSKDQYFDTIRQLYPWRTFAIQEIKAGRLPMWNPYNFTGSPLLANNQSQIFYPLTILYFILPQTIAWTILIMLQPFLATLFTFLYLKQLKLNSCASLFGAVTFGFCLFMTVFLEYNTIGHVILWLPLLLFSIHAYQETKKIRFITIFIFALTSAIVAGHLQLTATVIAFTLLYAFVANTWFKKERKTFLLFAIAVVIGIAIASAQLIPTIELSSLSARSKHSYKELTQQLLIQPQQIFMLISQDIFGNPATRNYKFSDSYPAKALSIGILPLFFVLFISFQKKRSRLIHFYLAVIGLVLLFVTVNPISLFIYRFQIPFLLESNPTNNIFLVSFSLSVLLALGVQKWMEEKHSKIVLPLILLGSAITILWMFLLLRILPLQKSLLLLSSSLFITQTILLIISNRTSKKTIICSILFVLIIAELAFEFWKFNPFTPKALVFPKNALIAKTKEITNLGRVWGYGGAAVEANFSTQYQFYNPEGYDPLYPKIIGTLYSSAKDGRLQSGFTEQTRSDAVIQNGFGKSDLPSNPFRRKLLNLINVQTILDRGINASDQTTFPPSEYQKLFTENDWTAFFNNQALPRAILIANARTAKTDTEFADIFYNPTFALDKEILLKEETPFVSTEPATGSAVITSYTPTEIIITAKTNRTQYLFLSDTYYPGWNAYIDQIPTHIYQANYAFRAIVVPPGEHSIIFSYEPVSFKIGLLISVISIVSCGMFLCILTLAKIHKKARQ